MNVHFKPAVSATSTTSQLKPGAVPWPCLNRIWIGPVHICTPTSTGIDMCHGPGIRVGSITSRDQVIRGFKNSRIKHSIFHPANIFREQRQ